MRVFQWPFGSAEGQRRSILAPGRQFVERADALPPRILLQRSRFFDSRTGSAPSHFATVDSTVSMTRR